MGGRNGLITNKERKTKVKEFLESWWFLITLLAIASALTFVYLYFFSKKRLKAKWWELLIISIVYMIIGVLCVRFWALLEAGFDVNKAGNISTFGSIFLAPIFFLIHAIIKKIPFKDVFDAMLIPMILGMFVGRCNCLRSGCCAGIVTSSGVRVPTRELELVFYALFIVFAFKWITSDKANGLAYPTFMISYGAIRFVLEWFRESDSANLLHMGHIWGIASMVIGVVALLALVFVPKRQRQADKKYEMNEGGAL